MAVRGSGRHRPVLANWTLKNRTFFFFIFSFACVCASTRVYICVCCMSSLNSVLESCCEVVCIETLTVQRSVLFDLKFFRVPTTIFFSVQHKSNLMCLSRHPRSVLKVSFREASILLDYNSVTYRACKPLCLLCGAAHEQRRQICRSQYSRPADLFARESHEVV